MLEFVEAAGEILADNKMPFFPAYTDHGSEHVATVLDAALRLIPSDLWDQERLGPADAAVLVGAAYLHDLALHMREGGFIALVTGDTPHKPLPWYSSAQRGRAPDEGWVDLWQAFRLEARHFNQSQLHRLLGPDSDGVPPVAYGEEDLSREQWTEGDRLLIGEFLRRHHARLGHEMAMFGFPGAALSEFPVLDETLPELADPIGVAARSHNENLRSASEYLDYRERGSMQPDGAAVLYLMGVLRIADFFQLDAGRASPLLLHLRDPQSPQSIEEWRKHQVITGMSWAQDDPLAVFVRVAPPQSLRTHLQVMELIDDLQRELDQTNAVLSERYGGSRFDDLQLNCQRVHTNIDEPGLLDRLSFVPARASLRSAEDLFRLVVGDLYGDQPAVAGRELLQNAVDAVRELAYRQDNTGLDPTVERWPLPADVLLEVEEVDDERNVMRITDRGIGMTADTVINSFLTAGATFSGDHERSEAVDASSATRWMKAGRFGVGAFAAFLLGREVHVRTRHASASRGISFVASLDDDLVQLNWVDEMPVGTEVTVPFSPSRLSTGAFGGARTQADACRRLIRQVASFYGLARPTLVYRFVNRLGAVSERRGGGSVPDPAGPLPSGWRSASAAGFDAVLWQVPRRAEPRPALDRERGSVIHNGIAIKELEGPERDSMYRWSRSPLRTAIDSPRIAVFDSRHQLEISLNRYRLARRELPFEKTLLESIGSDLVAHSLARGPVQYPLGRGGYLRPVFAKTGWFPLLPALPASLVEGDLCVMWDGQLDRTVSSSFVVAPGNEKGWSRFPLRYVAPLNIVLRVEDVQRESVLWGFSAEDARVSMVEMRQWLNWNMAAGVIVRRKKSQWPTPELSRGLQAKFWRTYSAGELNVCAVTSNSLSSSHTFEPPADWKEQEGQLVEMGSEVLAATSAQAVTLAAFRRPESAEPRPMDPVSRRWLDVVGGMVPRDPVAATQLGAEISKKDDAVSAAFERWVQLKSQEARR